MRTKQKIKSNLTLPEMMVEVCAADKELFVLPSQLHLCTPVVGMVEAV